MWKDKIKEIIYMLENSDVNEIEVRFWFKKIKVTKKNREFKQKIPPENYLQQGGFPNRACFREKINEALNIARPEVIF